jgi:hypothetical protein
MISAKPGRGLQNLVNIFFPESRIHERGQTLGVPQRQSMNSGFSLVPNPKSVAIGNDSARLMEQIQPVEQVLRAFLTERYILGLCRIAEMAWSFTALNHKYIPFQCLLLTEWGNPPQDQFGGPGAKRLAREQTSPPAMKPLRSSFRCD